MIKKVIGVLAACICVIFAACNDIPYWEQKGIYSEIEKEIELDDGVVHGNIFSIVEYSGTGTLYAGGGVLYAKNSSDRNRTGSGEHAWSQVASAPYGRIIRLAVSGGLLYALCAEYGVYKVYRYNTTNATGDWVEQPDSLKASLFPDTISTPDGKFTAAVAAAALETAAANITSLSACDGILYIGTTSGPKQVTYSSSGVLGTPTDIVGSNADASFSGYSTGAVYARKTGGRTDIYVSIIGVGSTLGSENNGLWGYYSDRGNWNRE